MADEPEHEHAEKVATLSLKDLRALVKEAGLSSEDCIEKAQLRLRAAEAVERLLLPGAKLGTVGKTLGLVATEAAPSASGDALLLPLPLPLPLPMTLPQTMPLPLTLPLTPASLHRSASGGAGLADLLGDTLLTKEGEVPLNMALGGKKHVMLYFSAHWCASWLGSVFGSGFGLGFRFGFGFGLG